jgi:SWI/SNF-related matrix-associated actin-dependent regulator 1 of chromatin subfamily A
MNTAWRATAPLDPVKVVREKTQYHSFALEFGFSPERLAMCRSLKEKYGWKRFTFFQGKWRFDDPEIILEFGADVWMDEEVRRIVNMARLRMEEKGAIEKRALELKEATDTTFRPEGVKLELYPYQRIGVEFFLNNRGKAILGDGMGLGKSAQALAYLAHSGTRRTLVVTPASVKFAWANEVKKWTKLKAKVLDSKSTKDDFTDPKCQIFIINYDILSKNLDILVAMRWDCVIADEAHMCKSRTAARTKAMKLISRYTPALLFLSGTPFLNRPEELFMLLNMIDPQTWNNYYDFTARYCGGKRTRWGWEAKGATNMLELKDKISKYFLRRTKEEVLKELPPKIFSTIPVKMEPAVQKEYDLAEKETRRYLREMKGKQPYELAKLNFSTEKLIQLGILRALTTKGKLKVAKEMVHNIIDGGEKVIVFSVYNEPLTELAKEFPQAVTITGKVNVDDRGDLVKKFQEDPDCNVFLGGIKSAGVGITLTAATHVLFVDFSWTPADHAQAQDRAHRIGTTMPVNIYQLSAQGTIDQLMTEILERKKMMFDVIIEGKETDNDGKLLVDELVKRLEQAEIADNMDTAEPF